MITVVIPTIGRATLPATLAAVGPGLPVIVVDDRKDAPAPLGLPDRVRVVRSGGRGPAAARNAGWRAADTPWVVFLDDDVLPQPGWAEAVWKDLVDLPDDVGGSQGRVVVPLPAGRPPTDAERNTAGLAGALWVTADMAYRRAALEASRGFDERFPRAYREDADLALRMTRAGWRLVRGGRVTEHPVRADGFWASVRFQRGNADDALMRRLHGPAWRAAIGGAPGRLRTHAATTAAGLAALLLTAATAAAAPPVRAWRRPLWRRSRISTRPLGPAPAARVVPMLAVAAGGAWAALTAEFAWRRIAPGPRTPAEVLRMAVTSVLIPPVAVAHRLRGEWKVRR
ncbi:GT2 family glycosyltransferase [Nonomuraea fuscirosea]|uniref:GT2 family glycosyltransferase n=1 Tax=Nonomuraea fuscirosea TaxID=1291556 RepID=A0A2T0MEH8_9ACTN|nr:glycosyltransferase [Nonomuraea fuscirosea]PRX55950.1 GT2 family glycosyltransferase [Nonomuraea fuscirosea]